MKKYKIIYADPPWSYNACSSKGTSEGVAERHYDLMSLEEIKNIPVKDIADEDSILFMWITMPHLHELVEVLDAWGFKYKTVAFTWVKVSSKGKPLQTLGFWTRANAELCILATRGKDYPRRISTNINQIILSKLREHSRKPDEARDRIVKLIGDLPRIELFARQRFEGWDVWGNEAPTETQKIIK